MIRRMLKALRRSFEPPYAGDQRGANRVILDVKRKERDREFGRPVSTWE